MCRNCSGHCNFAWNVCNFSLRWCIPTVLPYLSKSNVRCIFRVNSASCSEQEKKKKKKSKGRRRHECISGTETKVAASSVMARSRFLCSCFKSEKLPLKIINYGFLVWIGRRWYWVKAIRSGFVVVKKRLQHELFQINIYALYFFLHLFFCWVFSQVSCSDGELQALVQLESSNTPSYKTLAPLWSAL